jgi:hypothetical protein
MEDIIGNGKQSILIAKPTFSISFKQIMSLLELRIVIIIIPKSEDKVCFFGAIVFSPDPFTTKKYHK